MAQSLAGVGEDGLPNPDPGFITMLGNVGIDPKDFFESMKESGMVGLGARLPPGHIHSFEDLMMPALVRVGAITDRTREMFAQKGIPVWDDTTKLESFEMSDGEFDLSDIPSLIGFQPFDFRS